MLIMIYSHHPFTDGMGKVIAVLALPGNNLSYHESTKRAFTTMKTETARANFSPNELKDLKRGDYHALNVGLSYGNGHTKPTFRDLGRFKNLADTLLADADIQRLASYQDGE